MRFVYLMITCLVSVVVSGDIDACSKADTTLLQYIKWQMQSVKHNSGSVQCTCESKDKRIVAFQARLKNDISNLPDYAVVKFDHSITNIGNAYDKGTGYFTCPEDGVYSFSWSFLTTPGKHFHTELMVDGTTITYTFLDAEDHSKKSLGASNSAVAQLKSGNKVWLRAHGKYTQYTVRNWSSFSGFKI